MITLLGSILGLIGSYIPELFKVFQDKRDKSHELEMIEKQALIQKDQAAIVGDYNFDIEALKATSEASHTGIKSLDVLNGSVRPVLAYSFFFLYAALKTFVALKIPSGADWSFIYNSLWLDEDRAIFATIISFFFGNRALSKK